MLKKLQVLLISSDIFLTHAVIYILNKNVDIHVMHSVPPWKIAKFISTQPYTAILIDERISGIANVVYSIIRNGSSEHSKLTLLSFKCKNGPSYQDYFSNCINMLSTIDDVCRNLYRITTHHSRNSDYKSATCYNRTVHLSPREKDVIDFLITSRTANEAAVHFKCKVKTIYTHKYNALRKLGFDHIQDYLIFKKLVNIDMDLDLHFKN